MDVLGAVAATATNGTLYSSINSVVNATTVHLNGTATIGNTGLVAVSGTSFQGNGSTIFANIASGAGVAAWHCATMVSTSTLFTSGSIALNTFMENNIVWYFDGATPLPNGVGPGNNPQFDRSGTEEYFNSGFYFANASTFPYQQNSWMAISYQTTGCITVAIDLLAAYGGLSFNNGALCRWEVGQRASHGDPVVQRRIEMRRCDGGRGRGTYDCA